MLAEKDEGIASAIETTQSLWEEDDVRARAIARDDFIRRQKTQQAALEDAEGRLAKAEARIMQAEDRASQAEDRATQAEDRAAAAEAENRRLREELKKYQKKS